MGYLHIENLYKNRNILLFRECYALEKVHGTSAHIGVKPDGSVFFFSGGSDHATFRAIFNGDQLTALEQQKRTANLTIYGEAYGGKCQAMSHAYGKALQFVAFDVQIGEGWLQVEQAAGLVGALGLEFVPYEKTSTDLDALNALRDRPSEIAKRRGIVEDQHREGVVLRPLIELRDSYGQRIIAKHKGDAFSERRNTPKVDDPNAQQRLVDAEAIAVEWVTPMRLEHILGRGTLACSTENISQLIDLMIEDVEREAAGEIVSGKEARKAIGKATAKLVKSRLQDALKSA